MNGQGNEQIGKTLLEAFREAQKTGQIAITKETADILVHIMEVREATDTLYRDFSRRFEGQPNAQDAVSERIYEGLGYLTDAVRAEFVEYLEDNVFSNVTFSGL